MSVGAQVLKDAVAAIEDRQKNYGPPTRNFEVIASLWNAYLLAKYDFGGDWSMLSPADVAAMMRLVKEARLIETPNHRDSYVDIAGYAACGAEVTAPAEKNEKLAPDVEAWWRNYVGVQAGVAGTVKPKSKGCSCRVCEAKRAKEAE